MTAAEFRAARKGLNKTQVELAQALDMSERQIRGYEAGTTTVPRVVVLALSELRRIADTTQQRVATTRMDA